VNELLVDTVGRIRYLTINRPEKRNAITMAQLDWHRRRLGTQSGAGLAG
jgi:enoyl-CoA hydratase/carnithine racemase